MQDHMSAKEDLDRQRIRTAHLESEKELWKSSEARFVKENANLAREVTRRDDLLVNLQSMQQELQSADTDSKARLTSHVEKLEEEIRSLKRKLDSESERYNALVTRKEIETEEYRKQVAKLVCHLSPFPFPFSLPSLCQSAISPSIFCLASIFV